MGDKPTFRKPIPQNPPDDTVIRDLEGRWWQWSKFYKRWNQFFLLPPDELFWGEGGQVVSGRAYEYAAIVDQDNDASYPAVMCRCGEVEFQLSYGDYELVVCCKNGHETVVYDG